MYYNKFVDNFTEKHQPTKQYYENLEMYYSPESVCPKCKNKIDKNKEDDVIKMICTKCKWTIIINVAKYVNLYDILHKKKKKDTNLLYELTEKIKRDEKIDIEELKSVGIYDIEHILNDQNDIIDKTLSDQFKDLNKFYLLNKEKNKVYNSIIETVTNKNRIKLMNGYKEGKSIKEMIKNTGLSENTVKRWFDWLNILKEYILLNNKIRNDQENIKQMKKYNLKLNKHFLMKEGIIKENKEIKI